MKKIIHLKTKAQKRLPNFEIRKEHVEYSDGTTEDRTVAYSFDGIFLGNPKEADAKLLQLAIQKERKEFKRKNR